MASESALGVRCTLVVPREIVNADSVFVVRWAVDNGGKVDAGDIVCEIETSKAAVSIRACDTGYLRHHAQVGADVPVGGVLGHIMVNATTPAPSQAAPAEQPAPSNISAKARRKIEELGLDLSLFAGKELVREQDVLAVAAEQRTAVVEVDPRGNYAVEALGSVQRRVARAMDQIVAIPVSYLERTIDFAALHSRAQELTRDSKVIVSPGDVVVAAVARACAELRRFNSSFVSESEVRIFDQVNVGVAVDVENDLYVVVVKNADTKDIAAVASELRGLQYMAQRRRLEVAHLTGGTITVTSMIGRGVHRFQPLLAPQQSAVVGITDAESDGSARLTLGFDHRLANGSQAATFLKLVADKLSS